MKIEVEIPDIYIKRNLYIFAGLEPVARKRKDKWEIKTGQCSRCGLCCLEIKENHPLGTPEGCQHLERRPAGEQMCKMGIFRPHGCGIADGHNIGIETCTVKWERV